LGAWKWWVCGLLLFATTINYMDRQTLANAAVRITRELSLTKEQYGDLELAFGWAFAVGSLVFGFVADRASVRWLYPVVLGLWSMMGFLTAWTNGYGELLFCRTLLGFFEAGHWPCALKTTHALLSVKDRTMGNSMLQSGASIGAIITPLIMRAMMTDAPGSWRLPFQVVGAVGLLWVIAWFASIRPRALTDASAHSEVNVSSPSGEHSLWQLVLSRRFAACLILVLCIHTAWQLLRVWLPMFLQKGRGFSESETLYFIAFYYAATDIGCLAAGAISLWLARRGVTPHDAKCRVLLGCALLTSLSAFVAALPKGLALLGVLLLVGAGALGVFPCYYSFAQELSSRHVGKITGLLATLVWAISSPVHKYFGRMVDRSGSFDLGICLAGLAPIIGYFAVRLLWQGKAVTRKI
jgi:ACS family hexuronate transporter-like MFS transporter